MLTQTWEELLKHVDPKATSDRAVKNSRDYSEEAFKDHVITEEQPGVFKCAAPTTIIHSFRIAFLPNGMIVIYGDIGEMMIQRGGESWLRGAIRHDYVSHYVFEKAKPFRRWNHKEFFPGDALAEILRLRDGEPIIRDGINLVEQARKAGQATHLISDYWDSFPNPDLALRISEDWLSEDSTGMDADSWSRAYYKHTGDCEYPDCRYYDSNDLWCYFALSWFARKRVADEAA